MGRNRMVTLPKDSKWQNLAEMLRIICAKKIFTIAEISESTGISRQTVTKAINYFINEGILTAGEKSGSTDLGGRRANTFRLNPDRYIVIVMRYAKKCHFALLNLANDLIDEYNELPNLHLAYDTFLEIVEQNAKKLLKRNHIGFDALFGIMIGTGGIADEDNGTVYGSCGWPETVNLAEDVRSRFDFPVYVRNGNIARICASGFIVDSNSIQKRLAVLYTDYGIGVTMIDDGRIARTRNNITGELGHMVLKFDSENRCSINDKGCFESLVAEKYMLDLAKALPQEKSEDVLKGYDNQDDFRMHLLKRAEEGCESARQLTEYLAEVFGAAIRNIAFCFDPDVYIIQGAFSNWTESFKEKVTEVVKRNVYLKYVDFEIVSPQKSTERMMEEGSVCIMLQSVLEKEE